ncbi:MAG: hypothetical protein H0S79_12900 [Anaerolineaceae bacterium]|jgi:hypothetical protein|nr:hypothetical protein [Anaerolineaceae bacterium]
MTAKVECYAGSSYPEKPMVVHWQGRQYTVETVINQYREPNGIKFQVLCQPDQAVFELFYQMDTDSWEVRQLGSTPME